MGGVAKNTTPPVSREVRRAVNVLKALLMATEIAANEREGIGPAVTPFEWTSCMRHCPQQKNGNDCGVFVAMAMIGIARSRNRGGLVDDWALSQDTVDKARVIISYVIVTLAVGQDFLEAETSTRSTRLRDTRKQVC
jgi:hypothetical protein